MVLLAYKVTLALQGHRVQPELPVSKAQQVRRAILALPAHKATPA